MVKYDLDKHVYYLFKIITDKHIRHIGHLYVSRLFFPYRKNVTANMSVCLFIVVMCANTTCVLNIANTFPSLLTTCVDIRHKQDGLTSIRLTDR